MESEKFTTTISSKIQHSQKVELLIIAKKYKSSLSAILRTLVATFIADQKEKDKNAIVLINKNKQNEIIRKAKENCY